jgi:hypothetical protein
MSKSEIFILSEEHDECGSEKLSAYSTEAELIAAVQKHEGAYVKGPAELAEAIAKAREDNGRYGVNPSSDRGWGGSHIYVLSY